MSNTTSNPISVNQIVDTNLDLKCITEPTCRTLPNDIQALIDDYCNNKFNIDEVIKGCLVLPESYDINYLLNVIIQKLCNPITTTTNVNLSTINISGLNFCDSDNWTYTSDNCLTLKDSCNNPITTYTVIDVLRTLIKRIISLEILVKELKSVNDNQQTSINSINSQITNIINNCCNITLVSSINTINSRLAAAGIP